MIPLSRWLCETRSAAGPVAFGREGERSTADLRRNVASLAARMQSDVAPGSRILLHCDDAYAFAVGLLATAQLGARAVVPPSRQSGALRAFAPGMAGAVLDGFEEPQDLAECPCWHPLEDPPSPPATGAPRALDREAPLLEIFTSGTTGAGRPVVKRVRHLEDEVAVLETVLGAALEPGTRILATVAPKHLYGLLFRVLWPLASGRSFLRSPVLHPEELAPHARAGASFALATTPLTLRHVVEKGVLAPCAPACRAVYSSGGPLQSEWARALAAQLGAPPWEIYGSTETGGVAVRQQFRGGEAWRCLPGVAVASSGECLVVDSPFVSVGSARADGRTRYELGDRAVFDADGGFHLRGRADRVVKVGEKRLSLSEMEARLRLHAAVADVAVVGLGDDGETRVGAVLVAAPAGREIVEAGGRRALAKVLAEHLAADFDRVLLPRSWRVVDALPRDAQGKSPAAALRGLFAPGAGTARRATRAQESRQGTELLERLRIPDDLPFLEGHFPGRPLVAGVVQVHFVMAALEQLLGRAPRLERLERLKFRELLLPGQEVLLRVHVDPPEGGDRFGFSLVDAAEPARVFSSGRGRLATDPGADA